VTETAWNTRTPVPSILSAGGVVTLVEEQTFCVSGRTGDISPDFPHGVFVLDTRVLSRSELRLDGHAVEPLVVALHEPFSATFVGRGAPAVGAADATLVLFRNRDVGHGLREHLTLTNHGLEPVTVMVDLALDVDFADVFEVKEGRPHEGAQCRIEVRDRQITFIDDSEPTPKRVQLELTHAAKFDAGKLSWKVNLAPRASWDTCMELSVTFGEHAITPRFRCGQPDADTVPRQRLASWRARLPSVSTDHPGFDQAVKRASEDLGALRIFDPEYPELPILAAGAPWFMTVFGRDSLLTGWMTLPADPSLARGVLTTLARFQGTKVDDESEEEPGKILHEMRFGAATGLALGGGSVYYGSIDATPLFVMALAELRRWGLEDELVERLLPHADRAIAWIEDYGDRDGDGYVEYERRSPNGLVNQGWKDSWDAVRFADGTLARAPIALSEVQGYVYAAYVARAHFAEEAGDHAMYERCVAKAEDLRKRFNEDFWMEEHGTYALGLDADKRQIDAVTSNVGHCLWTGIVDVEHAAAVADRLLQPDLFSGWGVRTLATSMAAFNPVSYHNGSVWPHDNAICAAGLARYGFEEHAQRIIEGQLEVAQTADGRLPELFAGFGRDDVGVPGAYPASCSPQAWSAAAPLLWLRTLLCLDPCVPKREVTVSPELPPWMRRLRVDGIEFGHERMAINVEGDRVQVDVPPGIEVKRKHRCPVPFSD
jgi:glycogen debranching enzyme